MREFLLLPLVVVGAIIVLPLALIALVGLGAIMWIGEKQGWMKVGGIHRDSEDIGMW
jgi:hypothetical protein